MLSSVVSLQPPVFNKVQFAVVSKGVVFLGEKIGNPPDL